MLLQDRRSPRVPSAQGRPTGQNGYTRMMGRITQSHRPSSARRVALASLSLVVLIAGLVVAQETFAQRAGTGTASGLSGASRPSLAAPGGGRTSSPVGGAPITPRSRHAYPPGRPRVVPVAPPPAVRTAPGYRAPWRGGTHAEAVRSFRREAPWQIGYLRHRVPNRLTGSHRPAFLHYGSWRPMPTWSAGGGSPIVALSGSAPSEFGLTGLCQLDRRRLCLPAGTRLAFRGSLQLWCASRHLNYPLDRSGVGLRAACPESDLEAVWLRHPDLNAPVRIAPAACVSSRSCAD